MAQFILSAFADEAGSSIEEQIAALNENGITRIEPRNVGGKGILDLTDDEIAEVKAKLDAAGIKTGSLGSPIGKFPIEEPFENHLPAFRRALEVAKKLDTKNIRMFSFFVAQDKLEENRAEVMRRLGLMVKEARENGIALCHENESRIYGQMPSEVADILDEIPDLYGIFDPANYIMNNADLSAGIKATFKHFRYMHIKDATYAEKAIVPSGMGDGRIGEIIDLINDHSDDTVMLTLEPHLHTFDAYKSIDDKVLKNKLTFATRREAFDAAVKALKNVLTEHGFKEDENHLWKK